MWVRQTTYRLPPGWKVTKVCDWSPFNAPTIIVDCVGKERTKEEIIQWNEMQGYKPIIRDVEWPDPPQKK